MGFYFIINMTFFRTKNDQKEKDMIIWIEILKIQILF